MISLVLVFFRLRSDPQVPGELSHVCDSLSLRSAAVVDKVRGIILLLGVGLPVATVPVGLAFATLALGLAELDVLSAFASALAVVEVAVRGDVRGALPGVVAVLGFAKLVLVAAPNNPGVTEVATLVSIFAAAPIACVCIVLVLPPGAFAAVLASTPLSSGESSS